MKALITLLMGIAVVLSGCVGRAWTSADAVPALAIGAPEFSEAHRASLHGLLHRAFDWNSVAEAQRPMFYVVLDVLYRSDPGDDRVVGINFVSEDEVIVSLLHKDRALVVHPSGSLRVRRRAGFWFIVGEPPYRPV